MKKILSFLNISRESEYNSSPLKKNSNRVFPIRESSYMEKVRVEKNKAFNWYNNFPSELLSQASSLAPMLSQLGYDASYQPPTFLTYKKLLMQLT